MKPSAFILLNPRARQGKAAQSVSAVLPVLQEMYQLEQAQLDERGAWVRRLQASLALGIRYVIAAGGDGTVHALLNALVASKVHGKVALGAIGLGSSNDFHKPVRSTIAGIPVRIHRHTIELKDIGRVRLLAPDNIENTRHFIVSASVGITANANAFFNDGDCLLKCLKRYSTQAAIFYAATRCIFKHRPIGVDLRIHHERICAPISNLSVMKTPYLAGGLAYNSSVAPDDRQFAVHLCHTMTRLQLCSLLWVLYRARFAGRDNTRSWQASELELVCDAPVALELDGEIVQARQARFDVLKEQIRVCC